MTHAKSLSIESILEGLITDPDQLGAVKKALQDRLTQMNAKPKPYLVYNAEDDEDELFDNLPV